MKPFSFLYQRVIRWSRHRYANYYLGFVSFIESLFFPIPVDVMLVPIALAKRNQWVSLALIATVFSVLGGILGYVIGYGIFDIIKPWLIDSTYWKYHEVSKKWFDAYGVWVIFVAGFSPIPYKVFTITAGVLTLNLPIFIIASIIIGRAIINSKIEKADVKKTKKKRTTPAKASAWREYANEKRPSVKAELAAEGLEGKELFGATAKRLGSNWKAMSEEEKKPYQDRANKKNDDSCSEGNL